MALEVVLGAEAIDEEIDRALALDRAAERRQRGLAIERIERTRSGARNDSSPKSSKPASDARRR